MQTLILQLINLLQKAAPKSEVAIFAEKIERIRTQVSISATSSFRTAKHNADVGGVYNSLHLQNLAVDVVLDLAVDLERLKSLCDTENLYFLDEKDHYHLSVQRHA